MEIHYEAPCSKTDGLHSGSRSKTTKITLLPRLLFEFALSQLVATFHKRWLTYPWCCLQLIATYLALKCVSYSDYYYHHHHVHFIFECCWNMGSNGQPLLCSSRMILMAWVQFCQYTALIVTWVGCSLFQLFKLILLQLFPQIETCSACE